MVAQEAAPSPGSDPAGAGGGAGAARNRVVASQELLRSVWGPASTAARRSLQWQVWQLRRLLGTQADRLVYRAPGYLLRVEPGELDLARFQDLADQGRQALAAGDAEEAGRLLGD